MESFEYEIRLEQFTEYINDTLKDNACVKHWAFTIDRMIQGSLVVRIDYYDRLHSKDMYDLKFEDLEHLKIHFDQLLNKHLMEAYYAMTKGGNDEIRNWEIH